MGFDDLLIDEGETELPNLMYQEWKAAYDLLTSSTLPLEQWIDEDYEQVVTLHTHLKTLSRHIKTQMVTVLNLSVPQEGAGDND